MFNFRALLHDTDLLNGKHIKLIYLFFYYPGASD